MNKNEKNIIDRWNMMASKDLGSDINPLASEFAKLFERVFANNETQIEGNFKYINPIIRGFSVNNPYDDIGVVECLDLNYININKESAMALDWYLMNYQEWFGRYQYACNN